MRLQEQFLSSLAVGQLVMRRNNKDFLVDWDAGFVTCLSPLQVTYSPTDPADAAQVWDEVRALTDAEFIQAAKTARESTNGPNTGHQSATLKAMNGLENAYEIDKQRRRLCPDDPVKLLPNVCVSTVYTMYDTAADGAFLEKRDAKFKGE